MEISGRHWHQTDNRSFPPAFASELKDLYKGIFRIITQQGCKDVDIGDDHGRNIKEGKDVMNVELYQAMCTWFLEMGTDEGIFAHCFLVTTWNLTCRANSNSQVCFDHMFWTISDSLEIHFTHHKGDQMGDHAACPRHLYANPLQPAVCPIFAVAIYLMTFNTLPTLTGRLFSGKNQVKRFSDIIKDILKVHKDEVCRYGHEVKDIGTHSIQKGAATYASNCPGGPPAASILVCAGWSMGKARDIYLKWERGGDQSVGRCTSLLPLLKAEFGASPPHFSRALPLVWIHATINNVFAMVSILPSFIHVLEMCLAQIIYHRATIQTWDSNHVARTSCLLRDPTTMETAIAHTRVLYPWQSETGIQYYKFTGVPPHVAILHDIRAIAEGQRTLVSEYLDGLTSALDARGEELILDICQKHAFAK
jgi:hypothetical protein